MKKADDSKTVFLRAAEWCDEGYNHHEGACCAIAHAEGYVSDSGLYLYRSAPSAIAFAAMFKPQHILTGYWMSDPSLVDHEQRNLRVIALLLAHEMRQTGDL